MFICFVGVKFRILIAVFLLLSMAACHDTDESVSKVIQVLPVLPDTRSNGVPPASAVNEASAVVSASGVVVNSGEMRAPPVDFFKPKFEASDPAAPLEVAVLCQLGAEKVFILPIMSIPMHPEQFPNGRNNREGSMSMIMISQLIALPDLGESNEPMTAEKEEQELLKREELFVAQENYMSSIPKSWVDYAGKRYISNGAAARDDGMVGGALGFTLKDDLSREKQDELIGRVLLNRAEGFLTERSIPVGEWRQWAELTQELRSWAIEEMDSCLADKEKCKKEIDWLVKPEHINGKAGEFKLADGRKLQYINASSIASIGVVSSALRFNKDIPQAGTDVLKINMWRLINTDGSVQILRGGNNNEARSYIDVCIDDCKSQKFSRWTGRVIFANGQIYIIGGYYDGHTYGYLITEVLSKELKPVGGFSWGD